MLRTPDDLCLLCLKNKADKKGSHYTPAGISKKVLGERNYEDIYTIDAIGHSIENTKGRSNLDNQDPEIKKLPNVEDYIFCSECERRLGVVEGICSNSLNVMVDNITRGETKMRVTSAGYSFVDIQINRNVLLLFLYSIVWRQCLQQLLQSGTVIISNDFQEKLRKIVYANIYKTLDEIQHSEKFRKFPNLQLITTYHKGDVTTNANNPNPQISNPYLFYVSPYDILVYYDAHIDNDFSITTGYPITLVNEELVLNNAQSSIIAVVPKEIWEAKRQHLMAYEAKRHNRAIYSKLASKKQISLKTANMLILTEAKKLMSTYPDDFSKCMNLALEKLLNTL